MRLLVTGTDGLIGSNLAAAAAQQSWSVLGTWHRTPVSVLGARTAPLDVTDRHACATLAEELEPDVVVHAAAASAIGRLQREPHLAELDLMGTESTLAAARTVHASYVLVSCDQIFSGRRPSGECWEEEDPAEPINALGRSLLARERLVERHGGRWLITRPADVYGINLSIPPVAYGSAGDAGPEPSPRARHIWERSGSSLRWVAWLREGQPLAAPPGIRRSPTYAWDYAQRVCDLIAQDCEGVFNTAGPTVLGRLGYLRLLARAFGCELELVRDGASEETVPANTALCDRKASFVLGRPAVDPFTGHRLMRRQLEQLLGSIDPPSAAAREEYVTVSPDIQPSPAAPLRALG
jgi:dTDP-4-dehydrorhamnose reductase